MLNSECFFPEPEMASSEGLLALGGDLSPDRLLLAYQMGIFPWFSPGDPIMWWSPDPRCVLFPEQLKISKSMRNILNRKMFDITYDQAFDEVVVACGEAKRKEDGTWIGDEIRVAYSNLHLLGMAHSVEVWTEGELVGGLYGVAIGSIFFGESMFSKQNNASKAGLIHLLRDSRFNFDMVDCQIYNDHLSSLGAIEISRAEFLRKLSDGLSSDTPKGNWNES